MKANNETLNNFHENMDDILKNIMPTQESKQRVFDRLNQKENKFQWRKLKIATITSLACLVLIASLMYIQPVYAQVMPTFSKIVAWVQEITKIPVKVPDQWQPIKDYNNNQAAITPVSKTPENSVNYCFFIDNDSDQYNLSIYSVQNPVPVSQAVFAGQKGIPFGYREFGSLDGQRITSSTPNLKYHYDIPKNAEQFELIPGVKGYKADEGMSVWWKQGNWLLEFTGSNHSLDTLKELASAWKSIPSTVATAGHVEIIEGNMSTINVKWDNNGVRYDMYMRGDFDGKVQAELLNNFGNSDYSTPTAKNIISRIEKTTKIPVWIPQSWVPFAEYNKNAGDNVYKDEGNSSAGNGLYSGKYYYFEVEGAEEGYSINAYHAKYPVAFNDKEADLQKNGPKFEGRFAGSFSTVKPQQGTIAPVWTIPKGGETISLTPDITASNFNNDATVMWSQDNWTFSYCDNNSPPVKYDESLAYMKELASVWSEQPFKVAGKGHVNMTRDVKLHVYISWDENDLYYGYSSPTTNINEILSVLHSFKESKIQIP